MEKKIEVFKLKVMKLGGNDPRDMSKNVQGACALQD